MTDTIESLRDEIVALSARIDTMQKAKWLPQVGEQYFLVEMDRVGHLLWENDDFDLAVAAAGNVFRTEEEAERAHMRCVAVRILGQMADEDRAANPNLAPVHQCSVGKGYTFSVGPYFATLSARDAAQAKLDEIGSEYLRLLV